MSNAAAIVKSHTMVFNRAIELVGQIALSGDRQSMGMAECALDRLFGANLPAKYWATGSLGLTDSTVNTEFYDAGPVSPQVHCTVSEGWFAHDHWQAASSGPFVPLAKLLKRPLQHNQPVFTANMLAKPLGVTGTSTGVGVATMTTNTGTAEDMPSAVTPGEDGQSNTSISSGSRRAGSRLHTSSKLYSPK